MCGSCPSAFRAPSLAVKKVKRTRKLTVNQFSVGGDNWVLFHTHSGMGWPWISGPETELVDKTGFRLNRTFLWGSMLLKEPQRSGGPRCSFTKTFQFPPKVLCPPPSPKGISPGLVKTGVERYFRPWDRLASPLSVPSPKQ